VVVADDSENLVLEEVYDMTVEAALKETPTCRRYTVISTCPTVD
jgi:hypothetical protein